MASPITFEVDLDDLDMEPLIQECMNSICFTDMDITLDDVSTVLTSLKGESDEDPREDLEKIPEVKWQPPRLRKQTREKIQKDDLYIRMYMDKPWLDAYKIQHPLVMQMRLRQWGEAPCFPSDDVPQNALWITSPWRKIVLKPYEVQRVRLCVEAIFPAGFCGKIEPLFAHLVSPYIRLFQTRIIYDAEEWVVDIYATRPYTLMRYESLAQLQIIPCPPKTSQGRE